MEKEEIKIESTNNEEEIVKNEDIVKEMTEKDEFIKNTKHKNEFELVNVRGDGSCLYRTMIRFLVDKQKILNKHPLFYKVFHYQKINEKEAARNLQFIIKDWIVENQNDKLDSFMNIDGTISELLFMDHEFIESIEIYQSLYSIFSGDDNYIIDEDGKKVYIPVRWGGMTEIYAFYKIFGININQWIMKRWNRTLNKMEDCSYEKNGSRYHLLQKIGDGEENLTMNVLYINMNEGWGRHYMYLREKK